MHAKNNESSLFINTKIYNLGVDILRVLLSFTVVLDHLYNKKILKYYTYILYYHIPTFFLISFYFTYNTFTAYNIKKIKLRFERLLIPYISWSIIAYIIKNIRYKFKLNKYYSIKEFIEHLICGHIIYVPLWYLVILIQLTLLFLIIIFIFRNYSLFFFHILIIISYIFQYSGLNYYLVIKYLRLHATFTFGRFFESIPNAITGYTIAYLNLIQKLRIFRFKTWFFSISILIIISKYSVFDNLKTFKYGGLRLNIAASCIFIIFSLLPLENLESKSFQKFIKQITSYTGGIFYMHYLIGSSFLIKKILKSLNSKPYLVIRNSNISIRNFVEYIESLLDSYTNISFISSSNFIELIMIGQLNDDIFSDFKYRVEPYKVILFWINTFKENIE